MRLLEKSALISSTKKKLHYKPTGNAEENRGDYNLK
jgi:hypothetical protein